MMHRSGNIWCRMKKAYIGLNELGNTTEQLMKLCALGAIESIEKSALWGTEAVKMHLYAQAVSEALPEMRRTGSLREVTRFLREKKPESYFEVER